jgi:hypothetical protein
MRIGKFTLISALVATSALSADDGVPPIIKAGFEAYATKGPEAAWIAWGLEGSQKFIGAKEQVTAEDKAKFIDELSHADASYGKQIGFELIHSYDLGLSYKTVHVLWRFERKPLFCIFFCYRDRQTWKILNFFFGSDPRQYLPESLTGMPTPTK